MYDDDAIATYTKISAPRINHVKTVVILPPNVGHV
jgi:hypothetical protein